VAQTKTLSLRLTRPQPATPTLSSNDEKVCESGGKSFHVHLDGYNQIAIHTMMEDTMETTPLASQNEYPRLRSFARNRASWED
jgi:hypothetical protein